MDETEPLPKEFVDYLTSIKAWEHNWRIREYLRESQKLPVPGDVKDVFVCNGEVAPKDVWFFLDGYRLEAKNFLQTRLNDMK